MSYAKSMPNPNIGREPLTQFGRKQQIAVRRKPISGPDMVNRNLVFDVTKRQEIAVTRVNPTKIVGNETFYSGGIANPKLYRVPQGSVVARIGDDAFPFSSWVTDVSTMAELVYSIHDNPKGEELMKRWIEFFAMGGTYDAKQLKVRFFRLERSVGVFTGLGNPTGRNWVPSKNPDIVPVPNILQSYILGAHPADGGGANLVQELKDNADLVDEIPLDRAASLMGWMVRKYDSDFNFDASWLHTPTNYADVD